jgi:ribose transport system substrate-binding protein
MPAPSDVTAGVEIAFLPPASTLNYYRPIRKGIDSVAAEANVAVLELAPQDGADTYAQAGMIQDAISRGVKAIIITTHDDQAAAPVLQKAVDAGIVVVIVNSDIPSFPTPIHAIVGYNQRASTEELGRYVSDLPRKVGILEGLPGYHNTERVEGFMTGIDAAKVEVLGQISGSWSVEGGNTAALDLLQAHSDIDTIIAANDDMAIGAGLAGMSLNRTLFITGLDGQTAALEAVAAQEIQATIDTSPYVMGQIAMQVALDAMAGKFEGGWVQTPAVIRDADNVLDILRTPDLLSPAPSKTY